MDVRFENRYMPDERMLRAYFFRISRKQRTLGGIGYLAFFIACFAFDLPFTDMFKITSPPFLVVAGAIVAYSLAGRPLMLARRNAKSGRAAESAVRFGEKIERTRTISSPALDYAQIIAFYKTKRVWCLMLPKRNGLAFDPDGFTVGDPAAFEAFIREKCPNLK